MKADTMNDEAIRPGYKRTEVGVIPSDWEVTTIGDIFRVSAAGDLDKSRFSTIRDANYAKPIYSNALEDKGLYGYASYSLYSAGTITVTARGTLGFAVFRDHDYVAIGRVLILVPSKKVDSRFFTEWINNKIAFAIESTGVPQLTAPQISRYRVPVPSLPEQRAIAEVLSDVDALLSALDRLIAKKRAIKQGTMQALLTGRVRLPGFAGEWNKVKAGDIGRFLSGNGFPTRFQGQSSGDYPFFKVSDMNNEGNEIFMITSNNYIEEPVRKQIGATLFPSNCIVFAKIGAAVFLERKKILTQPSCLDNNMSAFIPDHEVVDYRFIHYVLHSTRLSSLVTTTALPSLSRGALSEIEVFLPRIDEQRAIAEVLSDIDAEIGALEKRRAKLRDLKQGMMQELLTGRIRLVQPQERAQEAHV